MKFFKKNIFILSCAFVLAACQTTGTNQKINSSKLTKKSSGIPGVIDMSLLNGWTKASNHSGTLNLLRCPKLKCPKFRVALYSTKSSTFFKFVKSDGFKKFNLKQVSETFLQRRELIEKKVASSRRKRKEKKKPKKLYSYSDLAVEKNIRGLSGWSQTYLVRKKGKVGRYYKHEIILFDETTQHNFVADANEKKVALHVANKMMSAWRPRTGPPSKFNPLSDGCLIVSGIHDRIFCKPKKK